ncbi:TIGR04282 family arsenosugar biosynthesis glycosyltransferase [Pontibacter silvestris]|uniref:TIGR04282 family arsenosugar biosynthesis glycosyltransferase n=1 Tax=Pontibacter silvestris TaxID=2305183 RepID=A0ABW4WTW4_9BACT|nr:TIGR04282 family arsenosugar biosynthesis glycosyltransferase [Pontibacter silvestris]MCC9137852.1 TIGR04282 family arsenosugar biosynthesis glycosyltransferase [Pontibacter silvestris]
MKQPELLILFVRNPELGKVKTRLAASVGPIAALNIYVRLLKHTLLATQHLTAEKVVYYSDKVETDDLWPDEKYQKKLQPTGDLGDKMSAAFAAAFAEGYSSVVIIGSDCQQLTQKIVELAFRKLQEHDVVIGPALDGGYYLLGMRHYYPKLFRDKRWSSAHVFPDTVQDVEELNLSYALLPLLSDLDYIEDLDVNLLH